MKTREERSHIMVWDWGLGVAVSPKIKTQKRIFLTRGAELQQLAFSHRSRVHTGPQAQGRENDRT